MSRGARCAGMRAARLRAGETAPGGGCGLTVANDPPESLRRTTSTTHDDDLFPWRLFVWRAVRIPLRHSDDSHNELTVISVWGSHAYIRYA